MEQDKNSLQLNDVEIFIEDILSRKERAAYDKFYWLGKTNI